MVEWELPRSLVIQVAKEELMVLDWVLSVPSHIIPDSEEVWKWSSFRMDIWEGINTIEKNKEQKLYDLPLTELDAQRLLGYIPITLKFGTGVDHGYNLKLKLYRFLAGETMDAAPNAEPSSNSSTDAN